ncbi:MAG: MBL fold metallo-hydrolase [Geminicoccaceae bacterium]
MPLGIPSAAAAQAQARGWASAPEFDQPVPVAEGIFWLRLRLPFALNHVNVWLCDDAHGWTVIDTGYGDAATRAVWEQTLAGLLAGRPVHQILVTHFHPDHFGAAGWLKARTDAELVMTRTEWLAARALAFDVTDASVEATTRCYRRAALPETVIERQRQRGNAYRRGVSEPPPQFRRIEAGQELWIAGSRWQVLIGEGHAPEQVTLYCGERRLLIAADQVLPRISPVIGVWASEPEADPLAAFLQSLEQYRGLPEDCRVLPSHGLPFDGLHARLEELVVHHEERLDMTLAACAGQVDAHAVLRHLFRRELDPHQMGFALGETLSHLNYLVNQGIVARWTDRDGVLRYQGC